jgi:hypothetical protein
MKILLRNRASFIKAIKLKEKIYLLKIEEYKPATQAIKDWQEKVL